MKTMTATTPPITAWSTPEEVDIAVGSEKRTERQVDNQSCAEDNLKDSRCLNNTDQAKSEKHLRETSAETQKSEKHTILIHPHLISTNTADVIHV